MIFLISLTIAAVFSTFAHEAAVDGFGCHSAKGGTYHCHSGPLAGRAFVTKSAAVNAMMALEKATAQEEKEAAERARLKAEEEKMAAGEAVVEKPDPISRPGDAKSARHAAPASVKKPEGPLVLAPPPTIKLADHEPIKVISWSASQLGKNNFDYKQVAPLIAIADLVILEDLSLTDLSRNGVNALADALGLAVKEKICRAIAQPVKGAKGRGAYLWKDRKLAFVRSNGMFRESCHVGEFKVTGRHSTAQFYVKHASQFINVTALNRDMELASMFSAQSQFPSIIAGDMGAELIDAKLNPTREHRFWPAFMVKQAGLKSFSRDFKPSHDQIFYRGFGASEQRVIDLFAEYPDLDVDQIRMKFSDHLPLYTEFKFPFDDEEPATPAPVAPESEQ